MQADNTRPHAAKSSTQFFEENQREAAPRPPYSLDLALLGFHLCGDLRECLTGFLFEGTEQPLEAIQAVLEGIENMTCKRFFSSEWTVYGSTGCPKNLAEKTPWECLPNKLSIPFPLFKIVFSVVPDGPVSVDQPLKEHELDVFESEVVPDLHQIADNIRTV
jgi:hypothetical protein